MSIVLLPSELIDLTGFKRPSKQAAWLKANGFKFRLSQQLHPKVDRGHYEGRMGGKSSAPSATEPNWGAMKGVKS